MRTDTKELNLKEVLDELDTQISGLIMIREHICRIIKWGPLTGTTAAHMKGICKYQAE